MAGDDPLAKNLRVLNADAALFGDSRIDFHPVAEGVVVK